MVAQGPHALPILLPGRGARPICIDPIVIKLGAACNWASEALIPVGELEAESSFSGWMTGCSMDREKEKSRPIMKSMRSRLEPCLLSEEIEKHSAIVVGIIVEL